MCLVINNLLIVSSTYSNFKLTSQRPFNAKFGDIRQKSTVEDTPPLLLKTVDDMTWVTSDVCSSSLEATCRWRDGRESRGGKITPARVLYSIGSIIYTYYTTNH
jgi:hypothetical protein